MSARGLRPGGRGLGSGSGPQDHAGMLWKLVLVLLGCSALVLVLSEQNARGPVSPSVQLPPDGISLESTRLVDRGVAHYRGHGVPQDYKEAVRLYRMAAELGDHHAMTNLGTCYSLGKGVDIDLGESVRWYRLAVERGNVMAMEKLAGCYHLGLGVERNTAEAVRLVSKAANLGSVGAMVDLGWYYADGEGVPMDHVMAYAWFNLAAAEGSEDAKERRARLEVKMTPQQISEGQSVARDLHSRLGEVR